VDEYKPARSVGLVSLGVGQALLAAPSRTAKSCGMGERPNLGRFRERPRGSVDGSSETTSFGIGEIGRVVSAAHA
jgi:hypothetical protein